MTVATLVQGCPLCGGVNRESVRSYVGKSVLFQGRAVVRCTGCGLSRLDPMPSADELQRYYEEGAFWDHVTDKTPFDIPTYHHQAHARIVFLEKEGVLDPGIRLLDIGAGFGVLEQALKNRHPAVRLHAVEPDPKARRSLENLGVSAQADLASFRGDTFDLIILSHVLEHIQDPIAYLQNLQTYCHRESRLFVEMPNQDHLFKIYLEPHVLFFDTQTLPVLLKKGGFEVRSLQTCGTRRSEEKIRNERLSRRQHVLAFVPFKPALRKMKRKLLSNGAGSLLQQPDSYECAVYGEDRIWIRALASRL